AVARYFSKDRGKALSLTSMGHPLGEAALPVIIVTLIGAWGWRPAMVATGGLALVLVMIAGALVRSNPAFRKPEGPLMPTAHATGHLHPRMKSHHFLYSRYFLMSAPLFIATPLIVTALVFHQAVIAQEKGFTLEWFAASFIAFAVARVGGGLLIGPVVDRIGTKKLFSFHVLPFCFGIGILAAGTSAWVVPVYWVLAGITSGMAGTLQAAIVAAHVAPDRLGTVRSVLAAMTILASAAGPVLYAWLAASGLAMPSLLWGAVAVMIIATVTSAVAGSAWSLRSQGEYS
ncbi:MAG: MFS transporter, partial [Burkholderiaceae bacterium]|nr:MFS transporter [Burkholderiaceae bacterium]